MTAIAGMVTTDGVKTVGQMLEKMGHRGSRGMKIQSINGITLGVCWPASQPEAEKMLVKNGIAEDNVSDSHYARAVVSKGNLTLTRDPIGVAPLYYGYTRDQTLCFASEVKGLLGLIQDVNELPPGSSLVSGEITRYFHLTPKEPVSDQRLSIASELRRRLTNAVEKRANRGVAYGAWLSGGLDSSIMAALARPYTSTLHTFAVGLRNAEDLEYARIVARHIDATHHEVIPDFNEILKILPTVIYHLESFDTLLVRSSLMNFLVAKAASDFVPAIFSGEGADELFAGYNYLRDLSLEDLPAELLHITSKLHNTALQRVDRCSAAQGTIAYLGFLDQEVLDFALTIPAEYKIYNGLEKWILRRSVYDLLPERVVLRRKAKFWEGAGVEERIAAYAEENVSESDFQQQRKLPNGELIQSKEELFYYRTFTEYFGSLENFHWMGRSETHKAPAA